MLILLIALPLLTGLAAALPFPSRRGRLTFLLTMQVIETALVVWTLVSGRSYTTNIWHLTESLTIAMKLDGVAAVFSALTVVAWLLALIYSVEYMSHSQNEARFYVFLFLSEGMLLGTALSADFVSMYVFYELTSLCSMPLVLHELTHDAVTGAMKYLYYSIGGAFFVLFGIVVLYTNTSTLDFAPGGTLIAGQHTGLELLAVEVHPPPVYAPAQAEGTALVVRERQVFQHGQVGGGARRRVLVHPAHGGVALVVLLAGDALAAHQHVPSLNGDGAADDVQKRGLAAAVAAHDGDELSFLHRQ